MNRGELINLIFKRLNPEMVPGVRVKAEDFQGQFSSEELEGHDFRMVMQGLLDSDFVRSVYTELPQGRFVPNTYELTAKGMLLRK